MIFKNPQALKQRITEITKRPAHSKISVFEDTSAFMSIDAGSVLRLDGNEYLVLGYARQGRHHGDIRADHMLLKRPMSDYVWIDFDYEVS